ncbi:MAG: helix-turn-helix domain-containing protein [Candidatus Coprovivens sp.]
MSKLEPTFGEWVKLKRKEQSLSQMELCKIIKMNQKSLSRIECGKVKSVRFCTKRKFAMFFDVDIKYVSNLKVVNTDEKKGNN